MEQTPGAQWEVLKCNTVKYLMAFLYSDWLYFLWHGINVNIGKVN